MNFLKITESDFDQFKEWLFAALPKEAGAFALAGIHKRKDGIDILIRFPGLPRSILFQTVCNRGIRPRMPSPIDTEEDYLSFVLAASVGHLIYIFG